MLIRFTYSRPNAATPGEAKRFCDALIATKRFFRDQHNVVHFKLDDGGELRLDTRFTLQELLLTGGFIELEGELDEQAFKMMWNWLAARRWTFPKEYRNRPRRGDAAAELARLLRELPR